jgi:hypothetical protein
VSPFWKKRLYYAVYLVSLMAITEVALRVYLTKKQRARFWEPKRIILKAYPTLVPLVDGNWNTNRFHVLVLDGSTLHQEFGDIETRVKRLLQTRGHGSVEIHNVSQLTHTSRDSWFKYQALEGRHFNLVVVYHGLNELRANNCPPDVFRADYSHYGWYELWNVFDRHRGTIRCSVIPYCTDYAIHRLQQIVLPRRYVPEHQPDPAWVAYGGDIKTAASFEENLQRIVLEAERRNEKVALLTYAWYVPTNYNRAAFERHELDYVGHRLPVELWGSPTNVVKGLAVHNAVIRNIATLHPEVRFVDMEQWIPKEGRYFDDLCHLSSAGCERFAERLAAEIVTCYTRQFRSP